MLHRKQVTVGRRLVIATYISDIERSPFKVANVPKDNIGPLFDEPFQLVIHDMIDKVYEKRPRCSIEALNPFHIDNNELITHYKIYETNGDSRQRKLQIYSKTRIWNYYVQILRLDKIANH